MWWWFTTHSFSCWGKFVSSKFDGLRSAVEKHFFFTVKPLIMHQESCKKKVNTFCSIAFIIFQWII
jgi:hypothetical protein